VPKSDAAMAKSDEHLPQVTYVRGNGNAAADDDDDTANVDAVRSLPSASNAKEATVFFVPSSSSWIVTSTPYRCCFEDQFTAGEGDDAEEGAEEETADEEVLPVASPTAAVVVAVSSTTVEKRNVLLLLPRLKPRLLLLDDDGDVARSDDVEVKAHP